MCKIIVGLSGGVDSAVTVHLLKKQGYQVIGVFLDMLSDGNDSEFKRAKILARQLGIELIQEDIKKVFQEEIINKFVNDYKKGITPNPCVMCNPKIKFKYLLGVANKFGIEKVATGHYAIINEAKQSKAGPFRPRRASLDLVESNPAKEKVLLKAKDPSKDQSYFLYRLSQKELQKIEFPLGNLSKKEVKKIAKELNLKIPKTESQDVCFLKNFKTLEEFLNKKVDRQECIHGKIMDENYKVIGNHRGLLYYTIGQRKGLDVGGDGPFYVTGKNFKRNQLLVTRNKQGKELMNNEIIISDLSWINEEPVSGSHYQIKIRYQMQSIEAQLIKISNKQWEVKCTKPVWAVTPGQSLVVYDRDRVVGGGIIN